MEALPHVHYLEADLSQSHFIQVLPEQADIILHLAQSNRFREFPDQALDIFSVNCHATLLLLHYAVAHEVRTFVYTSTGGIYTSNKERFKEEEAAAPEPSAGFYANSKYIGETLVLNYSRLLQTIIFRPFFIYGKKQNRTMLIPRLIDQIKNGKEILLEGEEGLRINPIHVKDAAMAVMKSLESQDSGIFNLGGKQDYSLFEICTEIGQQLQMEVNLTFQKEKQAKNLIGDIRKLEENIFQPAIGLKEGLKEMIDHEE